ncbi:hypothetical protein P154DRAFT_270238 [Amniculicola lignicola CBS 123094]|uniref:RING-CH-type domain-containing protein n=1 Tax=Amniculicola lignicola CBS 123094 TaxID=1392246 RepID=A0A6A5W7M2_9PLEO|nr:hypothetical protein P154DRAFT_270238 [Amniculicola lignicola CBS 123094]
MASSSGFQPMPGWYWPDLEGLPKDNDGEPSTEPDAPHSTAPESSTRADADANANARSGPGHSSRRRTHWPPRQCRICLETVQPKTNVPAQDLPNFLQSTPNVVYEDESGRLIRPCLCKGSSKFVHDSCLQAWRHADPSYGRRNYWQCPTCHFKYRLARLGTGRFIASTGKHRHKSFAASSPDIETATQIALTILILILAVFILGFIADPIINLYLDPWGTLSPWSNNNQYYYEEDEEPSTWFLHFMKGFTSMGVIGFLKVLIASPFSYFRIGGGGNRGRNTGRDRYEQVSWIIILIGVATFMVAVWKVVRAFSRRTLEKAGERVMDVQGDDDDDDDEE